MHSGRIAVCACALLVVVTPARAQGTQLSAAARDSVTALAAVDQFQAALVAGDSARAVSLLADDLMVMEAGSIETRADYIAHHLGADIKASSGARGERTVLKVTVSGDVAYVISKTVNPPSATPGSTGSELAELMIVSRTPSGWKIRAVHWSSRRRRA